MPVVLTADSTKFAATMNVSTDQAAARHLADVRQILIVLVMDFVVMASAKLAAVVLITLIRSIIPFP